MSKPDTDLDALEAAALAATPGTRIWKKVGSFNTPGCAVFWPDTSKGGTHWRRLDSGGGMLEPDAAYVAASSPAVVLELIRRLRAAERDSARWHAARSLEHCNAIWCAIGAGEAGKNLDATIDAAMQSAKGRES